MAPSREIEKLQQRWRENPLGLTFAPLAEAYRKESMFSDALELLDIGLSQHPSYVPAHIVRGRCFLDTKADAEAERSFLKVAELDPENVIALKGLADIAERAGRYQEAIERLERLLAFDRANEEARLQLDRLLAHRHIPMMGAANIQAEDVPIAAVERPQAAAPSFEPVAVEPVEVEPPPAETLLPKAEIVEPSRTELDIEVFSPVELTASVANEYQPPGDADSLGSTHHAPPEAVSPAAASVVEAAAPVEEATIEPVSATLGGEAAPVEPAREANKPAPGIDVPGQEEEAAPELVVTETMAEVFLRQGHRQLALAVYTQLLERDPNNAKIRVAVESLEAELRPAGASTLPAFAAMLTGGQSVRGFFEQLLAARRPQQEPQPTDLSLGAVFGEESARTAPSPTQQAKPDPSFDEFFADSPADVPPPPVTEPFPPEAAAEDLEQFTDWLKGLRR